MSKILLLAQDDADLRFISMVHRITGAGTSDLRAKIEAGQPFFAAVVFGNDHEDRATELRAVADAAEQCGVRLRLFELEPDEAFDECDWKQREIDLETMRNILDEADRRRQ